MAARPPLAALEPLLDQALDLAPEERAAWLAEVRARTPDLAREVEALLAIEPELDAREFLVGPANADLPRAVPSLTGRPVGAYTLERPLGQGGMGTVWLARRSDGRYDGTVAIKLLNLALLDAAGGERFRREGTALASLAHPNIARLNDAGVTDDGQPYLVLEHVEGRPIDAYCDEERLSPERRIGLFLQLLAAVAHAHRNLVVHRDLKPSNILVTTDGTVKLLDFGIAKLMSGEAAAEAPRTVTGVGWMTPEYAAPEQVRGEPITTSTDVYAAGVLLYELLAGRHPTGEGSRSAAEHFRAIVETEPPRLSTVATGADVRATSLDRMRRSYAGDLDNIVARALKKRPEERYASADALADDLRRYLSHEPVRARPDSLRYRTSKFVRRNRLGVALGAIGAIALIAATARERQLRARAERETGKAVAVEEFLLSVFGAADPYAPPQARAADVTARALLDRGARRIDSSLTAQPEVRAELRDALGRVYGNLGIYDAAAAQLRRSLAERRALHGARHHPDVARAMDNLGVVLVQQGRLDEADTLLRAALDQRRQLHGDRSDATAESVEHLADLLSNRNEFDAAEPLYREALAIRRALHGDGDTTLTTTQLSLAELLVAKGTYDSAAVLYRDALAIRLRALGENHPLTGNAITGLAKAEEHLGRYDEAERQYRRALAVHRKTVGDAHPNTSGVLNSLGQMLFKMGRHAEAESLLREALALNRRMFGENHETVSGNVGNLALVVRERGDLDEAERLLRQALAIDRAIYGREHTNVAYDLNELAVVLRLNGRSDLAVPILREALAQNRRLAGEKFRGTIAVQVQLGRALRETGNLAEAEQLFRDALTRLDPKNEDSQLIVIPAQVTLGRTLNEMGRATEALPLLESAHAMSVARLGSDHWRTAETALGLGECLTALRRYARADTLLRSAQATLAKQRRQQPQTAAQADSALARLHRMLSAGRR